MGRFIIVRLWQGIITIFILVTVIFVLARLIGNPVDIMLPDGATTADREFMIHRLGLDQPFYVQYGKYLWGLVQGDVGRSISFDRPVAELFFQYFPATLKLSIVAIIFALTFGFMLGMVSGTHRGTPIDHFAGAVSVIGMSAPSFWLGLVLMLVFAVKLNLLPVARMGGLESYILPGFTLSFFLLAGTTRLVRSSMIEVLDMDYVILARIKGVRPGIVVWKHCLRNALIPITSFTGVQLGLLLHGSMVIESIFAWPGVGRLIYQGIIGRDYPLVQGNILIIGFITMGINLLVDILYYYIDPRIRLD